MLHRNGKFAAPQLRGKISLWTREDGRGRGSRCICSMSGYQRLSNSSGSVNMSKAQTLDKGRRTNKRVLPARRARARIAPELEQAILETAFSDPAAGQDRVARKLRKRRLFVSASGVRYVWLRHNLETLERRVEAVSETLAGNKEAWTTAQLAARERVRKDASSRRAAARVMGTSATDFDRSHYILTIAAKMFREQGYDATSLRDIARAARVPVGSLHYHFNSKEELFESVYEESQRRLMVSVEGAIASVERPADRLLAACTAHLRAMCGDDDFMAAGILLKIPNVGPRTKRTLLLLNSAYEAVFKRIIADLQLPPNISPSLLRLLILGSLNWTQTWYKPGKAGPDEIAHTLVNILNLSR